MLIEDELLHSVELPIKETGTTNNRYNSSLKERVEKILNERAEPLRASASKYVNISF